METAHSVTRLALLGFKQISANYLYRRRRQSRQRDAGSTCQGDERCSMLCCLLVSGSSAIPSLVRVLKKKRKFIPVIKNLSLVSVLK